MGGACKGTADEADPTLAHAGLGMQVLRGKWKLEVLFSLANGRKRHGELQVDLAPISKKVLTDVLRELERDGVVTRSSTISETWNHYALTQLGWDLTIPVMALSQWGSDNADAVMAARNRHDSEARSGYESAALA